jgi:hypothetical protein
MSLSKSFIVASLIFLFFFTSQAVGQVLSDSNTTLPGIWAGSTAWGDYDGDGDPDLLIVGLTGTAENCVPIARIYRNTGGVFTDINAGLPAIYLGKAAWGDYDGDGDLDVAISGFLDNDSGLTGIYRNDLGSFVRDTDQNMVSLRYSDVAWGDYDADGDMDLLLSGMTTGGTVSTVLYKNGRIDRSRVGSPLGGRPILEEDVYNTSNIVNVNQGNMAWGDIDNDGDLDLAISGYGSSSVRQAQIYLNNPLGTLLRDERNTDLTPVSQGDLKWGDYDNDGDVDLMLSGWSNGWEAALKLYSNAAGILTENSFFSSTRLIGRVAWGDYDNDGDLDVAVAGQNSSSSRFSFILQNSRGALFSQDTAQNLEGLRGGDIAWADVENDGDLDLIVAGETESGSRKTVINTNNSVAIVNTPPQPPDRLGTPLVTSNGITLNWNDGNDLQSNSAALNYILRIGTTPGAHNVFSGTMATGQSNMGNRKTIQLSIPLARDTYYWSIRVVDGGFLTSDESQEDLFRVQDLVSATHVTRQLQNSALAFADYDNDGDLDLAMSGRDGDGIARSLIYRNSANRLSENTNIGLQGAHTGDLAWGDYDNDGDLDLALTGGDDAGNRFTHLYRNRLETEDFALNISNVANLPQATSSSLSWGDYDNDGDLDLAMMGNASGSRTAGIFRNEDGTFARDEGQALIPTDNGKLAWGDLDNDGDIDLATMGQINDANEAAFSLFLNANGLLSTDVRSSVTGVLASSIALGDYDNDGDLDLGITGFSIPVGLVTRLYNNDGSALLTETTVSGLTPAAASDLSWGDYDNDGDLDLAFVGQSATGLLLQVLRNQGGAFIDVPMDILRGMGFASVIWGDYDGDGDLDLVSSGRTTTDGSTFPPITRINDNLEARFNPNRNPETIATLTATTQNDGVTLSWAPSSDLNGTPATALTYQLRLGTTSGGHEILSGAHAPMMGQIRKSSHLLVNLTSGQYFWSVRAVDNGLATSNWAQENRFIVDTIRPVLARPIQVRPRTLREGRRATILIQFDDAPAGMDNTISPLVTLQLPGVNEPLSVAQISFTGNTWLGELDINVPTPGGTIIVNVRGARDLKGNQMLPVSEVQPALLSSDNGGVITSLDGLVRVTFSPNILPSLSENPDVEIIALTPVSSPSGATPIGSAYTLSSTPSFTLSKAATLSWNLGGTSADISRLAVYHLSGSSWTRIGGSTESGTSFLQVPIDQFGTYGLFEESTLTGGSAGISNVDFSNRAFSPARRAILPQGPNRPSAPLTGGSLTGSTDLSFELGSPATVRIEIYSRTGRLERILEAGRAFGAGRQIVTWDGLDHQGNLVKSGLYIVLINADGQQARKTVAVVNN